MPTTQGQLDPPLGNARLQVAKLLATLLNTNTHSLNVVIENLGTLNILLVSQDANYEYWICSIVALHSVYKFISLSLKPYSFLVGIILQI